MYETLTDDLSRFGARERNELVKLFIAWNEQGLPEDFEDEGVKPMFNMKSGFVFLMNEDYQVAMINDDRLESFYSCPECGHEGFAEDMAHDGNSYCQAFVSDIKKEIHNG